MKKIDRILKSLGEIRTWADLFDKIDEMPRTPIVLYGSYDAIWPTIGVEGSAWICLQCGRNAAEYSHNRIALAAGETHGDVYHPGLALTYTLAEIEESR